MKYPNLIEMVKYHPYHISTFADHAGVTTELMEEAVKGNEDLLLAEKQGIARLLGVPISLLFLPKPILMDRKNRKHQKMVEDLMAQLTIINEYHLHGSHAADMFMKYGRGYLVNLELMFLDDRATYCQYLGQKERVQQALLSIRVEQSHPRGLERGVNNAS